MSLAEACARMSPPVETMDIDQFIAASGCLVDDESGQPATLPL